MSPLPIPCLPRDKYSTNSVSPLTIKPHSIQANTLCLHSFPGDETRATVTSLHDQSDASDYSTPSSVLSTMSSLPGNGAPTLTPITNSESSPQEIPLSPGSKKRKLELLYPNGYKSPSNLNAISQDAALTPTQTPPEMPREARPGPGQIKGHKLTFDPDTALNLDVNSRKKLKPKYNTFGEQVRAASSQVIS